MNTTANKITIFRIILIPVFMVLAYQNLFGWALAVYIIACLSDVADGYIARHYNQVSNFGKFMDPLADKMLVLAAMCIFIERGQMPAWCVAIVLFREFAVSGLRLLAVEQGRVGHLRQAQDRLHNGRPRSNAGVWSVPDRQHRLHGDHRHHHTLFRHRVLLRQP